MKGWFFFSGVKLAFISIELGLVELGWAVLDLFDEIFSCFIFLIGGCNSFLPWLELPQEKLDLLTSFPTNSL